MAKSKHFVNEESSKQDESSAHKERRRYAQRLDFIIQNGDYEEPDEEFFAFERTPKRKKKTRRVS